MYNGVSRIHYPPCSSLSPFIHLMVAAGLLPIAVQVSSVSLPSLTMSSRDSMMGLPGGTGKSKHKWQGVTRLSCRSSMAAMTGMYRYTVYGFEDLATVAGEVVMQFFFSSPLKCSWPISTHQTDSLCYTTATNQWGQRLSPASSKPCNPSWQHFF